MSVTIGARIEDAEIKTRYQKLIGRNFKPDVILVFGIQRCEKINVKTEKKVIEVKPKKRKIVNAFKNTFQVRKPKRSKQ